jgi:hypothetical protein
VIEWRNDLSERFRQVGFEPQYKREREVKEQRWRIVKVLGEAVWYAKLGTFPQMCAGEADASLGPFDSSEAAQLAVELL